MLPLRAIRHIASQGTSRRAKYRAQVADPAIHGRRCKNAETRCGWCRTLRNENPGDLRARPGLDNIRVLAGAVKAALPEARLTRLIHVKNGR